MRSSLKYLTGLAAFSIICAAAPAQAAHEDEGPYSDLAPASAAPANGADANFLNLFSSWQQMDGGASRAAAVAIPSGKPVANLSLTSTFGVRSDPFNGRARMHSGIDIPNPAGTPVYATADGVVGRAERAGGYGNLVQIEHGNGLETRYGHLSRILVEANAHVHKGQLIGLVGSTGRSTGPHLHYEVRVAGQAVNPVPFVQGNDYLLALNTKPPVAMGGPEHDDGDD